MPEIIPIGWFHLAMGVIVQRMVPDTRTGMIGRIELDIRVPSDFPEKYHEALIRAASQCAVKKHLETPPAFDVRTVVSDVNEKVAAADALSRKLRLMVDGYIAPRGIAAPKPSAEEIADDGPTGDPFSGPALPEIPALEELDALIAKKTGRAAKIRPDRDDDMIVTGKRHEFLVDYEVGFDRDGGILAVDMTYAARCGWSADLSGPVSRDGRRATPGWNVPEAGAWRRHSTNCCC